MPTLLETLMQQVKSNITEISSEELNKKICSNDDITIIDVRDASNWQEGHLLGAINCQRGLLELKIEKIVPDLNKEIITYCGGGTRSALSAESLQRMGYTNVKSLAGGYRDWVATNLPLETTS